MDNSVELSWALLDSLRAEEQVPEPPIDNWTCTFCSGRKIFVDGFPTCEECGIQDKQFVCEEAEWRSGLEDKADPSRVGAPVNTDHFSAGWGQSTLIQVRGRGNYALTRMARIHQHSTMNHRDRALFHAYAGLDRIGKFVLNLPDVVMYHAKIKYKAFNEVVLTRGAVRNGIKANCVFQACREHGVARTTQEIADAFGIPARDLSRTFQMYQEQLPETDIHVTTPANLIPRLINDIKGIPDSERGRVKMRIIKMCESLQECVELMGRTPKAIACAVIFIVLTDLKCGPPKAEICRICEVSAPTLGKIETIIRNQLKDTKQ